MTSRLAMHRAATGFALAAALAAAGCATPYQAKGLAGGFSDKQVAPGRFTVEFVLKALEPVVKGDGKGKAVRADDVAKTAMVNGRGRAQARGGTSLDDLQRLLQPAGERP